ncbi:MAG: SurA N-terminal domain-containing protein [Clostridia bacterium]|nr:SurA N-terminal domain-containing protein [Clostridia bacterium]
MKKLRLLSFMLCLLLLSGCVASPVVVTINGDKIDGSEFAYYLNYELLSYENPEELTKEQMDKIKENALESAVSNTIVLQKCKEYNLELTDEEEAEVKALRDEFIEDLGGSAKYLEFLNESALNDRVYKKTQEQGYYHNKLLAYLTENTDQPESIGFTDESLRQFFAENYVKIKYICMTNVGEDGLQLSGTEYDEQLNLARIVAEGSREPEKDFDLLIEKYNDDYRMRIYPDGFVYSKLEIQDEDVFCHALELEENEIGGPYASTDGFYIIKRYPADAGYFDKNHEEILNEATDLKYELLLEEWKASAVVKVSDVYNNINASNYREYIK